MLGNRFGGTDEPWRALANKAAVRVRDEDSGEMIEIVPRQEDPDDVEGLLIWIRYTDASGGQSERVVLCRKCWTSAGALYVQGYCTAREALRTFRADRMRDVVELRGNVKIADPIEKLAETEAAGKASKRV